MDIFKNKIFSLRSKVCKEYFTEYVCPLHNETLILNEFMV